MLKKFIFTCCLLLVFFIFKTTTVKANDVEKLRVGSLQYGSVNWELKLIKEFEGDLRYILKSGLLLVPYYVYY